VATTSAYPCPQFQSRPRRPAVGEQYTGGKLGICTKTSNIN